MVLVKKGVITLELFVIAGLTEEDKIELGTFYSIDGIPNLKAEITGEFAYQGGWGTASRAVNSIPHVIAARPSIITVEELPPSPCLP